MIKSTHEVACLVEAGRQACEGYKKLLEYAVDGNPETMAAGAAEGAARMAGAEDINFMVFGSGKRTETVIGRATNKIMRSGEMLMAAWPCNIKAMCPRRVSFCYWQSLR